MSVRESHRHYHRRAQMRCIAIARLKAYLPDEAGKTGAGHGQPAGMDPGLPADLGPARASKLKSDWARAVEHERLQEAIDSRITAIRCLREEIRALRAEQGKLKTTTEEAVGGLGRTMEECGVGGAEGEEGTESEGNGTGRRGEGVLKKWRELRRGGLAGEKKGRPQIRV